ncbi:hypothetical protein [Salibacterium sp. K-3]
MKLSAATLQRLHSLDPLLREPVFITDDVSRVTDILFRTLETSRMCSNVKRDAVVLSAQELMTNALKYAGNGLLSMYYNHKRLFLLMEDQGPGLEPSILMEAVYFPGRAGPHTIGGGLHRIYVASDKTVYYSDDNLTAVAAVFST